MFYITVYKLTRFGDTGGDVNVTVEILEMGFNAKGGCCGGRSVGGRVLV